jgi:hypothetical protein
VVFLILLVGVIWCIGYYTIIGIPSFKWFHESPRVSKDGLVGWWPWVVPSLYAVLVFFKVLHGTRYFKDWKAGEGFPHLPNVKPEYVPYVLQREKVLYIVILACSYGIVALVQLVVVWSRVVSWGDEIEKSLKDYTTKDEEYKTKDKKTDISAVDLKSLSDENGKKLRNFLEAWPGIGKYCGLLSPAFFFVQALVVTIPNGNSLWKFYYNVFAKMGTAVGRIIGPLVNSIGLLYGIAAFGLVIFGIIFIGYYKDDAHNTSVLDGNDIHLFFVDKEEK